MYLFVFKFNVRKVHLNPFYIKIIHSSCEIKMNLKLENKEELSSLQRFKHLIGNLASSISATIIPLFQFIPCASIWFGIMSIPLFGYLIYFFSYPSMILYDFKFFFGYGYPWSILALFAGIFALYCFIYQLFHRKKLIKGGPYKIIRHPQYLGLIIMTFFLTMICLRTYPVYAFSTYLNRHIYIVIIWIIETIAYVILAKIEDISLSKRYGKEFENYKNSVGFMFPSLNFDQTHNSKIKKKSKTNVKLGETGKKSSIIQKFKNALLQFYTSISAVIIPIFQYIPTASIWLGFMSMPLILYFLSDFFCFRVFISDFVIIYFHFRYLPWNLLVLLAGNFTLYSFIYQLIYRKDLTKGGPYKIVRHPQYLGLIIMIFGLTMISLKAYPILFFLEETNISYDFLVLIWIIETIAYVILAKIEDISLSKRYGKEFENYKNSVGFMFPLLKPNREDKNKTIELLS
ncbi:MAG: hypothetical protein EU547_07425 [Promethearchaeota archaeon]|nr:MAG: hypothetical protein EU547_07425 [Candidatus Lokiarchaeota archaeon]